MHDVDDNKSFIKSPIIGSELLFKSEGTKMHLKHKETLFCHIAAFPEQTKRCFV